LKKLNEIIDQFKKNIHNSNDGSMSQKTTVANTLNDDPYVNPHAKKKSEHFSDKDYFLNQKRKKTNGKKKLDRDESFSLNNNIINNEFEEGVLILEKNVEAEKLYCVCNKVSFGEMVKCDNNSCVIEWFHFECKNLTAQPKGKWYCSPECTAKGKKKKSKV